MAFKKIITLFALFLFIFHFTITFLFNSPIYVPYIKNYMVPLFDQNWRFFAPDPTTESRTLFFRYRTNKNNWSIWLNPGKISQRNFDYNRFSYDGKIVHLNAAICHYLNAEVQNITYTESYTSLNNHDQKVNFYDIITKSGSVDLAKNYLKNWTYWKFKQSAKELQIILLIKDNQTGDTRSTLFPILKLTEIEK